jgi:sugar lactone lactonase YvrE
MAPTRGVIARVVSLLLLVCCSAAFAATGANAAVSYESTGAFGSGPGSEAGEFNPAGRVAVQASTGNVFVVDPGNARVQVFAPAGGSATYLTKFGNGVLSQPVGIAIDQDTGSVYVSDAGANQIFKFDSDAAPQPSFSLDPAFSSPAAGAAPGELGGFGAPLAFDDAGNGLLVADPVNNLVDRFQTDGTFDSAFDGSSSGAAFTALKDIATLDGGNLAVVDGGRVERFDTAGGALGAVTGLPAEPDRVSFNSTAEEMLVGHSGAFFEAAVYRVDASGQYIAALPNPGQSFNGSITGIAAVGGSPGHVYVGTGPDICSCFVAASGVTVFASEITPDVTVGPPSGVTATAAHLSGTINPLGKAETTYRFETFTDGGTTWSKTPETAAGEGVSPEPATADVADLEPNTKYQVRLVGTNPGGSNVSSVEEFTTLVSAPEVVTGTASERRATGATLHGSVNPFGLQTNYHFEYGTSTAYGSRVPVDHDAPAGPGRAPLNVSQPITGLVEGTVYHYRLVAENSAGQQLGADQTFTTASVAGHGTRGYELVTPGTAGSTVLGEIGTQVRPDGGALIFATYAAEEGAGAEAVPQLVRYASLRAADGWQPRAVDAPVSGLQPYYVYGTIGASEDVSHVLTASDRALAPGGFEGGGNLYLRDTATGKLSFVGGNPDHESFRQYVFPQQPNKFLGGSPDFSTVVFTSEYPFTPEATPGVANVYKWSAATGLQLESILPSGAPATINSQISNTSGPEVNRVSRDGSVVAFGLEGGEEQGVYARVAGETTVPLSVSQVPGDPATPHPGAAVGVSADGRYADFFTVDEAPLTPQAPAREGNLYRYDLQTDALSYLGGPVPPQLFASDGIRKGIVASSRTTDRLYFLESEANLKLSEGGQVKTVAMATGLIDGRSVSPSGRYLAFDSAVQIGSFENGGSRQVYLYDAEADSLACVSCPEDGRLPTNFQEQGNNHTPKSVTDEGEVFFDSAARFVGADINGKRDVYSYKDGSLTLISPGDANFNAVFMDASASGDNVFFKSAQPLAGARNNAFNVYDARVGGGFAQAEPQPGCVGEACQASAVPPVLASPTIAGGGSNASPRRGRCVKRSKGAGKRRASRCAKKKQPRHHRKAAGRRAGSTGRAGR